MKALMLLALLAWGAAAGGQQSDASDSRSRIIALENVWNHADESGNAKAIDTLLDDAFVHVDPDGKLLNKAETLAHLHVSHGIHIISESMVVHLHGDTAVVTGIYRTKGIDRGKPFLRRDRFVDTWRYKNGMWISIASLTTAIGS
ncbi:MAG TPA: nuclear transport factor 2 family protein [Candidatus Sulfotelmatobacter sp.]